MRNAGGYAIWFNGDGPDIERDTYTCGHCNKVSYLKPKQQPTDLGGLCKVCSRPICEKCCGQMRCDPIEKKLERAEARGRFQRTFDAMR